MFNGKSDAIPSAVMFDINLLINVVKSIKYCGAALKNNKDSTIEHDKNMEQCGNNILGAIGLWDPTGITGIIKAFKKPKCDHS